MDDRLDIAGTVSGVGMSRRRMLVASAGATATAWVVPTVLSQTAAAAASGVAQASCYGFNTPALDGWNPGNGGYTTSTFVSPPGCLTFTVGGSGGDGFGPLELLSGSVNTSVWYSSTGGAGFFGVDCYSDVGGTVYLGEIWIFGSNGAGELVTMANTPAWTQYTAGVTLLPGTQSVRFKAEVWANLPVSPVFFDDFCFDSSPAK